MKALPEDFDPDGDYVHIVDLYVTGTRLRVRRMTSPSGEIVALKLGQKFRAEGQPAIQTTMTTLYLDASEYAILVTLGGASLVKRRYAYPAAGHTYQLDVFEETLSGLLLAEIEAHSDVDITTLPVPHFAASDVTGDPFFSGGALANLPQVDFQRWLAAWRNA